MAVGRTYFNIVDKPPCLKLPAAVSVYDHHSLPHALGCMLTNLEIKHISPTGLVPQAAPPGAKKTQPAITANCNSTSNCDGVRAATTENTASPALIRAAMGERERHIVSLCTAHKPDNLSRVDVFVTLTGQYTFPMSHIIIII